MMLAQSSSSSRSQTNGSQSASPLPAASGSSGEAGTLVDDSSNCTPALEFHCLTEKAALLTLSASPPVKMAPSSASIGVSEAARSDAAASIGVANHKRDAYSASSSGHLVEL